MITLHKPLPQQLELLNQKINEAGGHAYVVGGAVLDIISDQEVKDWDIEVFNLSYSQISSIAEELGKTDLIGQKFGVVKLNLDGLDIELAIPRVENNIGPGHKDFDVEFVPNLLIPEAARRRDITINALYLGIKTKRIYDPYGGLRDYVVGNIDHIDPKTFIEDPLRAFRVMQLVARKGKRVTKECIDLCSTMKESCATLSGDAIYGEFVKMLMLSERPDRGLRFLEESGLVNLFPELSALIDCPQKPKWHPEGDVWTHTQLAVREAAIYRDELPEEWRLPFMFGMLLHDVGKPTTLDKEKLSNHGHDIKGVPFARAFMERLTKNEKLIDKTLRIVKTHMRAKSYLRPSTKASAWRKLHNKCPLQVLAYVSICDGDACNIDPSKRIGKENEAFKECMRMHKVIGEHPENIPPVLMGRHLIVAGHKPGTKFGVMLNKAYEHQLETGCEDIQELLKVINED
jgi:tRNA nucleotidyltransferase (CCA-adding enzyme)